ncbi:MAG: hypothetical protein ABH872_06575 [Candidatus Omnitrophota bacterium]
MKKELDIDITAGNFIKKFVPIFLKRRIKKSDIASLKALQKIYFEYNRYHEKRVT